MLPVWEDIAPAEVEALTERLDGLVLTGSHTNVEPQRYGAERAPENTRADLDRDALAWRWYRWRWRAGCPAGYLPRVPGDQRGARRQLYQAVQNQPGKLDHREPEGDKATRYAPVHDLEIRPGGVLSRLFEEGRSRVNSLHQQGIDRLADGLTTEAVAPDGLVEAVSVTQPRGSPWRCSGIPSGSLGNTRSTTPSSALRRGL